MGETFRSQHTSEAVVPTANNFAPFLCKSNRRSSLSTWNNKPRQKTTSYQLSKNLKLQVDSHNYPGKTEAYHNSAKTLQECEGLTCKRNLQIIDEPTQVLQIR